MFALSVELYAPTVSVTGGGTTSEDSGTPVNFAVSRDLPDGYVGTSAGDDAMPDTVVNLVAGGTATPGDDYTGTLPTSTTLNGTACNNFSVTPIWDNVNDESDETATLSGTSDGNGSSAANTYNFGPANEAEALIHNVNKVYTIETASGTINSPIVLRKGGRDFNALTTVELNGTAVSDKDVKVKSKPNGIEVKIKRSTSDPTKIEVRIWASNRATAGGNQSVTLSLTDDDSVTATINVNVTN